MIIMKYPLSCFLQCPLTVLSLYNPPSNCDLYKPSKEGFLWSI